MIKFEEITNINKNEKKKTFTIITLGCKVNIYESEAIRNMLEADGYEYNPSGKDSDLYIINSCAITNVGESKSRKAIRRARRKNPKAVVVVLGCYSQIKSDEVLAIEGVNLVIGTKNRSLIPELIRHLKPCSKASVVSNVFTEFEFEELGLDIFRDKTRVFLKVQDGCNMYCTYCIIPFTRGNIRSRDKSYVISEIVKLEKQGYKEVVLTGIHLASYGRDIKAKISLIDLIESVSNETSIERIRLGSLEPLAMGGDVIERLAKLEKLCPQFHLSLQSGCDRTLKAMNRRYDTTTFYKVVEKIKKEFDNPALTTDIIVGFPGETDEDFEETVNYVKKVGFSSVHVFKYSKRDGTKASAREDQVDEKVKNYRSERLISVCETLSNDFKRDMVGKEVKVLIERSANLKSKGHSENHVEVEIMGQLKVNEIYKVKIVELKDGRLKGVLV